MRFRYDLLQLAGGLGSQRLLSNDFLQALSELWNCPVGHLYSFGRNRDGLGIVRGGQVSWLRLYEPRVVGQCHHRRQNSRFRAPAARREDGQRGYSRFLALLRRMFKIARTDGKIQFMPVVRLLKEPPPHKGFLARAQFEHLLSKLPAHLRPLVTLLYYCGVRVGEAIQIEWSQVDLQAALIRLEGEQTKTSEARVVPLPDVLVEILKRVKKKEGLVFSDSNLCEEWTVATKAAEMPGLLVHDLRRSAIRNLVAVGVPEKVAMSISGHKTRAVFDRYHIADPADVVNAMSKLQNKQLVESENGESLVRGLLSLGAKCCK